MPVVTRGPYPYDDEAREVERWSAETGQIDREGKKMGMWFFLFTEILFFGGMFLLYSIFRYQYAQEFHAAAAEENLVLGTVNTVILLTSSYTIALADRGRPQGGEVPLLVPAGARRSSWGSPFSSSSISSGRPRSPWGSTRTPRSF